MENDSIIIRLMQPGDEYQISRLINASFHNDGFQFLKTPEVIKWRFSKKESSSFETIFIICENIQTKEIVGTAGAEIHNCWIKKRLYRISDMLTMVIKENYRNKGLSKKITRWYIDYIRNYDILLSKLSVDPSNFLYKTNFVPNNYFPLVKSQIFIRLCDIQTLVSNLPPFLKLFSPFLYIWRYIRYFQFKICNLQFKKEFEFNIIQTKNINKFMKKMININKKYYNLFPDMNEMDWKYSKINIPHHYKPQFFYLKHKDNIIAGLSITFEKIYIKYLGSLIECAVISDFFIDYSFSTLGPKFNFLNAKFLSFIQNYCSNKKIPLLLFVTNANHKYFDSLLMNIGFFKFDWSLIICSLFKNSNFGKLNQIYVNNSIALNSLY